MLGKAQNLQHVRSQQEKLTKLLASIRVTGTSKNGKVTVVITGEQKIVEINIDPALIKFVHDNFIEQGKPDTMLSKAIMEAFEDATSKVQSKVVEEMQKSGSINDLMDMLQSFSSMNNGGGAPAGDTTSLPN